MKVFISWSGPVSKNIASKLQRLLVKLPLGLETWMSTDIRPGAKWRDELESELVNTDFGIVCLTPDNMDSAWLRYETDSLTKMVDKTNVVLILHGVESTSLPSSYRSFQTRAFQRDSIWMLVQQLNDMADDSKQDPFDLEKAFSTVWDGIDQRIKEELDEIQPKDALSAYETDAKRFGVGHSEVRFEVDVDGRGYAEVRRSITVEAYSEIRSLDTLLLFHQPENVSKEAKLKHAEVYSLDLDREVDPLKEDGITDSHSLSIELAFRPPLTRGETSRYVLIERAESKVFRLAILGDSAEFEELGWNVYRPTKSLFLRVTLPEGEEPSEYNADVRRASFAGFPSERVEEKELSRLSKPACKRQADGRCSLSLSIAYPVHGFIYFVKWKPDVARQ